MADLDSALVGCFALATDRGFAIYNSFPLKELTRRGEALLSLNRQLNQTQMLEVFCT